MKGMDELDCLKRKTDLFFDYLRQNEPQMYALMQDVREKIEKADGKKKLKYLRASVKEIDDSTRNVPQLQQLFARELGEDIGAKEAKRLGKIDNLLKRGYLKTDEQARMIDERLDELSQAYSDDDSKSKEIDALNDLLLKYEDEKQKKMEEKRRSNISD